jgi:uncharacterized protein (TIRG00374 family)
VKRIVHLLALAVGVVGFAILVDRVGWQTLRDAVTNAGWWFLWIALIDIASVFSDAAAVWSFARGDAPISFWRAFAAQASGSAINRLTPGNTLGEGVKVAMLVEHVEQRAHAVSAIVKFNLATLYVALGVVVLGVPLTLLFLDLPANVQQVVWIGIGVIVLFAILLAMLLRRGALASIVAALRLARVISDLRAARWTRQVKAIDGSIRSFRDPSSSRGVVFVVVSRVLHCAGIVGVLHAAAVPMTPPIVICMMSVGIIITGVSSVVPLGVGLADGTNYLVYGALGSAPLAGIAYTMVNRTRTCVLAAFGLGVLAVASLLDRRPLSERNPDVVSAPRTEISATP